MNITLTIDDQGNPMLSQEGDLDLDSFVKEMLLESGDEIRSVFEKKFKNMMDSVKVDGKKISKIIEDSFTPSAKTEKTIQDSFTKKTAVLLEAIKPISKKVNSAIEDALTPDPKLNKKLNAVIAKKIDSIESEVAKKKKDVESDVEKKKPEATDRITSQNANKMKISRADEVETSAKRITESDIDTKAIAERIKIELNLIDVGGGRTALSGIPKPQDQTDTTFEAGPQQTILTDIEPTALEKIGSLFDGFKKGKGIRSDQMEGGTQGKGGGIWDTIKTLLAGSAIAGGMGGLLGLLGKTLGLPATLIRMATSPVGLVAAGLLWMAVDGIKGYFKADQWGTTKTSAVIGAALGGLGSGWSGAATGAAKWALLGAGIGTMAAPGIGTLIGLVIGAVVGAILGFIGGERIAKALDKLGVWLSDKFDMAIGNFKIAYETLSEETSKWWKSNMEPAVATFKRDMVPVLEKVKSGFKTQTKDVKELTDSLGQTYIILKPTLDLFRKVNSEFAKKVLDFHTKIYASMLEIAGPMFESMVELNNKMQHWQMVGLKKMVDGFNALLKFMSSVGEFFSGGWKDRIPKSLSRFLDIDTPKATEGKTKESNLRYVEQAEATLSQNRIRRDEIEKQPTRSIKDNEELIQIEKSDAAALSQIRKYKAKDLVIQTPDIRFGPKSSKTQTQIQLDGSDTLESFDGGMVAAKQGGTLDKAIGNMSKLLTSLLERTIEVKAMLNESVDANKTVANVMINEMIPAIRESGSRSPMIPAETKIPDGYMRDPIYEFRMKLREV